MKFKEIEAQKLSDNPFKLIGDDWLLLTAGQMNDFNTMTASWGTVGVLWHLPVAIVFIRPQRHTYQFANMSNAFTLSFFNDNFREVLTYCGKHSGKDVDKMKETGLNPFETQNNMVSYEQSRLYIECKKLYTDDFKSDNFLVKDLIKKNYPNADFHRFFIGEILSVNVPK